jgi:hypothetical protein
VDGTCNDPRDTDRGWSVELAFPWSMVASLSDAAVPVRAARRQGAVFLGYDTPPTAAAVPMAVGKPPRGGDRWRVNFSRVEWQQRVTPDGKYERIPNTREDNWVWSPQGVIDMHRPETWGYVEFSAAAPGLGTPAPDPAGAARHILQRVYYAQIGYRNQHHRFAARLDELGLNDLRHDTLAGPIQLELADGGFQATATVRLPGGTTQRWHIRADSRIWCDR